MHQHEIKETRPLLDEKGRLAEPGFSRRHLQQYDRSKIAAPKFRIKEWDYYYVGNDHYGLAITVADLGYLGMDSISILDFDNKWQCTKSPIAPLPMGRKKLPPSTLEGDVKSSGKNHYISYKQKGSERIITFMTNDFWKGEPVEGEIKLCCPDQDSMVIATPFADAPKCFYYNEKINCMPASGEIRLAGRNIVFDSADSFGTLDWGRGVWTRDNVWYWGSASGIHDGVRFGFNIGYGFGDTSAATENMLFYDGKAHKLSKVRFVIPALPGKTISTDKIGGEFFIKPWRFTSDDGRFNMIFKPILDRSSRTNAGFILSDQHQVFGRYTGTAVLDDGTVLEIKDLLGFAEKVHNRW